MIKPIIRVCLPSYDVVNIFPFKTWSFKCYYSDKRIKLIQNFRSIKEVNSAVAVTQNLRIISVPSVNILRHSTRIHSIVTSVESVGTQRWYTVYSSWGKILTCSAEQKRFPISILCSPIFALNRYYGVIKWESPLRLAKVSIKKKKKKTKTIRNEI